uniref:Copper-sensing transcriptional repressor CsoR n=1 Tax=Chlorobium chlorochromatii (strain CaD3) TaxID=340177 RepID=Q3AUC6_CHLCH
MVLMEQTTSQAQDVIVRLKKVSGQVDGLIKMLEREDECMRIITQFQAVKAALDSTFSLILHRNLRECVSRDNTESMERILKLISKQ